MRVDSCTIKIKMMRYAIVILFCCAALCGCRSHRSVVRAHTDHHGESTEAIVWHVLRDSGETRDHVASNLDAWCEDIDIEQITVTDSQGVTQTITRSRRHVTRGGERRSRESVSATVTSSGQRDSTGSRHEREQGVAIVERERSSGGPAIVKAVASSVPWWLWVVGYTGLLFVAMAAVKPVRTLVDHLGERFRKWIGHGND